MDKNTFLNTIQEYKELGMSNLIDYDKFYLYSIVTHSTAIEGSTMTEVENQEVVTKCDHLQNLKYSRNSPHAFTEAGIFMLATLIDSNEARNVAFEIIETFTEHQQLLRHIMVAEYKDEYGKKKEEAYMEDKLKHILARSSACI